MTKLILGALLLVSFPGFACDDLLGSYKCEGHVLQIDLKIEKSRGKYQVMEKTLMGRPSRLAAICKNGALITKTEQGSNGTRFAIEASISRLGSGIEREIDVYFKSEKTPSNTAKVYCDRK